MNREIKFRAWDKKNKQWLDTFHIILGTINSSVDVEYMQFTGLHDIWEGDIVKVINHSLAADIFIGEVKFNRGRWEVVNCLGGLPLFNFIDAGDSVEVIGNVHQHPELLKD